MNARSIVHVHGGTREHRRELARALQNSAITVLLSSNTAEAAKCLRDSRVLVSVILDDALFAVTIATLRPEIQCLSPAREESIADTVRAVLHELHQDVPTSST